MTYPTPSHARGKHSKVMQRNHKAFGKSRACSGSLEDHLTCCAFGTVLWGESALARLGEDKNAAGAWRGANTLATNRRAAVHQDRHSRDREQRRVATLLWTHLMPPALSPTHRRAPKYSTGEWRHHLGNTNLQNLSQPLRKCLYESRHNPRHPDALNSRLLRAETRGEGGFSRPSGVVSEPEESLLPLVTKL